MTDGPRDSRRTLRVLFGAPLAAAMISPGVYVAGDSLPAMAGANSIVRGVLIGNAALAALGASFAGLLLPEADLPLKVTAALLFAPVGAILYAFSLTLLIGLAEAGILVR